MNQAFRKSQRLRTSKQFQDVNQAGIKRSGTFLIIHFSRPKEHLAPRLGITVARQYGKAHERNRFKRLVREAFRTSKHSFPSVWLNVKPKPAAKNVSLQDLSKEFLELSTL